MIECRILIEPPSLRRFAPVSRTTAGAALGASQAADGAVQPWRVLKVTPVGVVIAAATLVALGLRGYQLGRPGELLGVDWYDDGVLFGSSLRLAHGVLPYKDFVFAQPPGITLLMVPAALLSKAAGTAWGMAVGRILTLLASSAAVALGGLLVRHRGLLAVVITCGLLAVYPASVTDTYTVFLEPWLVLFCLAGALAVFDGDRMADSRRRLLWGGVLFGFGGAIESWAIVPVAVVVLLALAWPRKAAVLAGGVAVGFLVPVLPFAVLAPRRFYDSVFLAQLVRYGQVRVPVWTRLQDMTGLGNLHHVTHATILLLTVLLVGFVAVTLVAASLVTRRPPPPLERFGLLAAALVVAGFMWPPGFFFHFPAFLAPWLALALALPASRLLAALQPSAQQLGIDEGARWISVSLAAVVALVFAVIQAHSESTLTPRVRPAAVAAVRRAIPPGACVLTDQASFTIAADRFTSDVPGCSLMIDPLGTDYALSPGRDALNGAGRYPAVESITRYAFDHAQYVWLAGTYNLRRIAWTPALRAYFNTNFVRVLADRQGDTLYVRRGLHPS
jgi:alpha-1,2-mannosyltransferase